jgi:hypothetical protein
MTEAQLASVVVGGPPGPWEALGFTVVGGMIPFRNGAIEIGDASPVPALRVSGADVATGGLSGDLDGVPLLAGPVPPMVDHANGAVELDHVVIRTPSLERTSAAVARTLGLPLKRIRERGTMRQGFHRFPERGCIVELVETGGVDQPGLWGVVVIVDDIDAFVAGAGPDLVGAARDAVQPGRRIATVRRDAGLPCPVAVMSR